MRQKLLNLATALRNETHGKRHWRQLVLRRTGNYKHVRRTQPTLSSRHAYRMMNKNTMKQCSSVSWWQCDAVSWIFQWRLCKLVLNVSTCRTCAASRRRVGFQLQQLADAHHLGSSGRHLLHKEHSSPFFRYRDHDVPNTARCIVAVHSSLASSTTCVWKRPKYHIYQLLLSAIIADDPEDHSWSFIW